MAIFWSLLLTLLVTVKSEVPTKIVAGAFWKELPESIIYEATIPITYTTEWLGDFPESQNAKKLRCNEVFPASNREVCEANRDLLDLSSTFDKHFSEVQKSLNPKLFINEDILLNIPVDTLADLPTTTETIKSSPVDDVRSKLRAGIQRYRNNFLVNDAPVINNSTVGSVIPVSNNTNLKRNKRALQFIGNFFSWCCGVATEEKLKTLTLRSGLYKKKLEELNKGVHAQFNNLVQQNSIFNEFNNKMHENFEKISSQLKSYEKKFKGVSVKDKQDQTEHFNFLANTAFDNLKRMVHMVQLFRNNEILNASKNHFIPIAILPPHILKADLKILKEKIETHDHTLVIPVDELSRYYKIAIADCSIAENKIILHVKIPVQTIGREWQLLELLTTPFSWKDETCVVMHDTMYLAVSGDIMRPISGAGLHQCKPYHDKLCFLPRFASDVKYGPQCAYKMYTGATVEVLNKHCTFRCHPSNAMLISEVKQDTYILTHLKNDTYTVCDYKRNYFPYTIYEKPGAVQLELPCNCALYVNDKIMIPARFPCEEAKFDLNITHILPITWSNLKSFKFHPLKVEHYPIFSNLTDCLNANWSFTVPHLNLTTPSNNVNLDLEDLEESIFSNYIDFAPHSDILFLLWNVIISVLLFLLWQKLNNIAAAQLLHGLPLVRADVPKNIVKMGPFPIILLTILIIIFLIIIFFIYRRYKTRRERSNDVPLENFNTVNTAILYLPNGRRFEVSLEDDHFL